MVKKIFPYLIAAVFLLAAQPAVAFDAGNWFTGRVAALGNAFASSQMTALSSGRQRRSTSMQQVMQHFKEQHQPKKQHSRP